MSVSQTEKRFLKYWEEQRKGGKAGFVATYTFGYTIVVFMMGVAFGLFTSLRFVTATILISLAVTSLIVAFGLASYMWQRNQKKFSTIIQRELNSSS